MTYVSGDAIDLIANKKDDEVVAMCMDVLRNIFRDQARSVLIFFCDDLKQCCTIILSHCSDGEDPQLLTNRVGKIISNSSLGELCGQKSKTTFKSQQ